MLLFIIGCFLSFIVSIILSYNWITISNPIKVNSESFRDSTKLGITITTLAFPLLIASPNYFESFEFWRTIAIFSVSTFFGLWNNFSIATLADEDGKIEISKQRNSLLPTILVLQFLSMLYGILLVLIYAEKPKEKKVIKEKVLITKVEKIYITRFDANINNSNSHLIKYWGIPNNESKHGDTLIYSYKNLNTITRFKILKDSIIEINERKLNY